MQEDLPLAAHPLALVGLHPEAPEAGDGDRCWQQPSGALVTLDVKLGIKPGLAESWTQSKDGLVYVCDRLNNRIQVFQKNGHGIAT